jgi:Protein of unknown function (DUF3606)
VDDKTKTRPQDSSRINMNEDYEVAYWTKKYGVTTQQLQAAVDKAGVSVAAVEKELLRRGHKA